MMSKTWAYTPYSRWPRAKSAYLFLPAFILPLEVIKAKIEEKKNPNPLPASLMLHLNKNKILLSQFLLHSGCSTEFT